MTNKDNKDFIVCTDLKGKRYKVKKENLKFRPSAYAVIIKGNKVLLSKQWDGYDYPGGAIELGETIEEALKRECFEEVGAIIKPKEILLTNNSFFKLKFGKNNFVHSIQLFYKADLIGGELSNKNVMDFEKEYIGPPEWIAIDQIAKIKFYNQIDNPKLYEKCIN